MLKLFESKPNNIKSTIVSAKSSVPSISPLSLSSSQHMTQLTQLVTSNLNIMDTLFSSLNRYEKWFVIERVCRSWRRASKVNGCGWKALIVTNHLFNHISPLLVWFPLIGIGRARLSRQRHVTSRIDHGSSFLKLISRYLPRLTKLHLHETSNGETKNDLSPLSHCSSLTSLTLTQLSNGDRWEWSTIPSGLRHLSLGCANRALL
jgi:hypothetical protein